MEKSINKVTKRMDNCIDLLERINANLENTQLKLEKMDSEIARENMQDEILDVYEELIEEYIGVFSFENEDITLHIWYNGTDDEEEIIITAKKIDNFRYNFTADSGSDISSVNVVFDKEKAVFQKTYFDEDGEEEDYLEFTLYDLDLKEALEYLMLYSSVVLEEYIDNFLEDKLSVDYQISKIRPLTGSTRGC